MRVRCKSDSGRDLPPDCRNAQLNLTEETAFPLTVGKEYVVYALTIFLGHIWYYICDENYTYYPVWNPSPLFDVVDGRISQYWKYNYFAGKSARESHPIFAFDEWASDKFYYDRLTDGVRHDVSIFEEYKRLMDAEFS